MNPEQNEWQERPAFTFPCANCGSNSAEYDSPSKLCADCRTKFVRFPIPLWIKGFGLGLALVLVLALTKLPGQISLGISLERGREAIEKRNYLTAQQHLEDFVAKVPGSDEAQEYLLIASFYNHDFEAFGKTYMKLEGKEVKNDDLYERVNSLINLADNYFPTDSFTALLSRYDNNPLLIPDTTYRSFLRQNVNEIFATMHYGNMLYEAKEYHQADSILKAILEIDPEYAPAFTVLAGLKRQQDSLELSLKYCNRLLSINHEHVEALCSKSRTLLKMRRDKEAVELARRAFALDSFDGYVQSTLALAYHLTNKPKECDELLQTALKTDTASNGYAQHVLDIINGKEKYR